MSKFKLFTSLFKIYPAMDMSDTELSPGELVRCHYPFPKHQKKLIWPNKYRFIPQDQLNLVNLFSFPGTKIPNVLHTISRSQI